MRYYNYLNENRSQAIDEKKFNELLQKNCSQILNTYSKNKSYIFRGIKQTDNYYYIDPTKSTRVSRNLSNYYTILFDEILPSWKGWPKRSKSIICLSLDVPGGSQYGTHYKVYPYNGSNMGICSNYDIWTSFQQTLKINLDEFVDILDGIARDYDIELDENNQSLLSFIKTVDSIDINKPGISYKNKSFLTEYKNSNKTFFNYLNDILNPITNKFEIIKPSGNIKKYREIWIEGPCLLESTIKKTIPTKKEVDNAISTILGK